MSLPKKIVSQIYRYYEDLEKNGRTLDPVLSDGLQQDALYEKVMLGIAKREKARFSFKKLIGIAAVILILSGLSVIFYQQLERQAPQQSKTVMHTAVAAKGRVVQLSLADGTEIWLNSGSKLTYPQVFNEKTREVTLEGEGYFQVAHDAAKPFLIHSEQLITRVLGTTFNIKAYLEDKNIKIAVLTGKVRVNHPVAGRGMDSIALTPNQQITFNKAKQQISLQKLEKTTGLISWREGRLHYDAVPLHVVIADLQRKYAVEIRISPEFEKRRITADFRDESIKKVMVILSEMTGSKVTETKEGFLLH